ncbi:hypothetical protein Lser_V15G33914 [Lactuca serriola]
MGGGGGGRSPCCDKSKVKKGPWSPAEDVRLVSFIQKHGHSNWRSLPKQAGLLRCGKSCRLRWINYLRPDVKRGSFTPQEEHSIIRLHATFGNKWSKIASQLPGRTDNEIKNVWNTHLKKRSVLMSKNETFLSTPSTSPASNISISIDQPHINNQEISSNHLDIDPKVIAREGAGGGALLVEVIDQPSTPSSTASCNTHDEVNLKIPSESEVEFWNMLEDIQLQPQPIAEHHGAHIPNGSIDVEYWMRLLEEELGLVDTTPATQQIHQNDLTETTKTKLNEEQAVFGYNTEMWCKINDEISTLWPTSPQNFGF